MMTIKLSSFPFRPFDLLPLQSFVKQVTLKSAMANYFSIILCLCLSSVFHSPLPTTGLLVLPNHSLSKCQFDAIYQLGDSSSDTGNLIQQHPESPFARLPYGETFFSKKPTGRCSDGLLIIDYLAISAGIPLLDPYLNPTANLVRGRGVNFAVAGSTALPTNVLSQKGIFPMLTNTSLNDQLDWMFTHFNSICYSQQDCAEKVKSALFVVGEIGGSDYMYGLYQGLTINDAMAMVPDVVGEVASAITRVISYGARRIVVPGHLPFGCLPFYLTQFKTNVTSSYNRLNCLKKPNTLSITHNRNLKQAIQQLNKQNPNVTIVYGDLYSAYHRMLRHSTSFGRLFQKACCGTGGDYEFDPKRTCGAVGVPVCPDPSHYISWDGVHLTQTAYRSISSKFISDIFPLLRCN